MYETEIKKFYEKDWEYLANLNYEMLIFFLKLLNITTDIVRMRDYNFKGKKDDLVLDMCSTLGAKIYIFGEQGRNYADSDKFRKADIISYFQEYKHPVYPQLHGEFISHLSIVDLLFNCGEKSLDVIMKDNINKGNLLKSCTAQREAIRQ